MIREKTLIIAQSAVSTANTTAMQNNATRMLCEKAISFTPFIVRSIVSFCWINLYIKNGELHY
jgi:hypothetical protein